MRRIIFFIVTVADHIIRLKFYHLAEDNFCYHCDKFFTPDVVIQDWLARAAIHGQHLIEEGSKFVSHRHVSAFFVLGVGTPCNELEEFDELHLVELFTIRNCVCDHYHLRHTKAVDYFFQVANDPSMLAKVLTCGEAFKILFHLGSCHHLCRLNYENWLLEFSLSTNNPITSFLTATTLIYLPVSINHNANALKYATN